MAETSPAEGLERLAGKDVPTIVCGDQRVDLRAALGTLAARYDVRTVRVDSGGSLSGALVRAGLVDEVSVLLELVLVGGVTPRTFLRGPDPAAPGDVAKLRLVNVEQLDDGVVWLRYEIEK